MPSFGLYLFVYTPLKHVTTLNTMIGAAPGALPPLIGWAAATGELSPAAWTLFLILYIWQLPHFLAIAWIYREDYARGGFRMVSVGDRGGRRTSRQVGVQTALLIAASLLPTWAGLTGPVYLIAAIGLGVMFAWFSWRIVTEPTDADARRLLLASVVYLPILLIVMMIDCVKI